MARLYVAGCVAGVFGYHFREVVPGAHALVGVVIHTLVAGKAAVFNYVEKSMGEVAGVCGGAGLVKDDFQLRFGRREVEHGLDKISAILGVEPRGAEYESLDPGFGNRLLTVELGEPRRLLSGCLSGLRGTGRCRALSRTHSRWICE